MNMLASELTSLQIFRGLDEQAATAICQSLKRIGYDANENILSEGVGVQALWIILSGECIVSRNCGEAEDRTLAVLRAGDVFGEMSFVRSAPHSASIKSVTPVSVCCFHREDFLQLAKDHPSAAYQISLNIAAVLSERLRRMDAWVCDMVESPNGHDYRDEWQSFRSAVYTNWAF
ncbi:MAG: cyclic nucleotide-binding domain-containing protein [Fuerstiella sp.]